MEEVALTGGFQDAPREAARAFRAAMEAMARPGTIHEVTGAVPPAPLSVAAGVLILVLCDGTTRLHLAGAADCAAVRDWVRFHTGAPLVAPEEADFAVGDWAALLPLSAYRKGEAEYPDRSATLIVEVARLEEAGARLKGPGIAGEVSSRLPEVAAFRANRALFPLGLDFFLTCGTAPCGDAAQCGGHLMYVAVKGGETAIANAHAWLAEERRGDRAVADLSVAQIREQLALAVNRVMAEGSLYDPDLAALAIKQARGDLIEAVFLIRAYRTTLPRLGPSRPVDTGEMVCERRISATFKDLPGGQILGPTFDYTHRLLDFALAAEGEAAPEAPRAEPAPGPVPHVMGFLDRESLIEGAPPSEAEPQDLTRAPLALPADRALRLQALARGDEGFLLSLAYSTQRGYGRTHAFVGELRIGTVEVEIEVPELGFAIPVGEVRLTECETVNQFGGSKTEPPQFTRGYGLCFGQSERKALAMGLVDRALRWQELGEEATGAPAQDEEFVLMHCDNVQATGFLEHIKLPHYVDFQSELELVRKLRRAATGAEGGGMNAYNFAYLDEQTKRMIRRAILKALAIPGYQVPFASREMPMPYGWGTGGVQVSAAILVPEDRLKVIDQGADDTTNAVSIRTFFERTAGIATTTRTAEASVIQTRHRIPEERMREGQVLVYQVPIPEPLRFLEPRETETRRMHALEDYGLMHVKLYEDIARHGEISTAYAYPVQVEGRYVMDPSPIPKFDNPRLESAAIQLFGAGREQRIYALPPHTRVVSLDFEDHPFVASRADHPCALCGARDSYLDEVIVDDAGGRMFVCSDTDFCEARRGGRAAR